jgi:hypothetical protein
MLSYCDHEWLVRHGPTRFELYITASHRQPKDVMWSLELHYMAAGAQWRRVREHQRPQVSLSVSSWHLPKGQWTDLEDIRFWDPDEVAMEDRDMPLFLRWPGGWLDLCYTAGPGAEHEISTGLCAHWQVRERQGARFLVELAADPDGLKRLPPLEETALVLADGDEEQPGRGERDLADFWKQSATIYAMEWVPFGKVTVRVPRNAPDVVAYARRRVHEMTGLSLAPEAYQVNDFLEMKHPTEDANPVANGLHDDVFVKLHYHAYHEDE